MRFNKEYVKIKTQVFEVIPIFASARRFSLILPSWVKIKGPGSCVSTSAITALAPVYENAPRHKAP